MGKVFNYVMISLGLALIFEMAGMPVATDLLTKMGINLTGLSIQSAAMYLLIFGVGGILIGLTEGLVIGYLTKSSPENYIILPFIISGATLFFTTFYGIVSYTYGNFYGSPSQQWVFFIILFPMALLAGGFMIALYEHFRASD